MADNRKGKEEKRMKMQSNPKLKNVFGHELVWEAHRHSSKDPRDLIVLAVHWRILANDLQCCGIGDYFSSNEEPSELLPLGWSSGDPWSTYSFKYWDADDHSKKYILRAAFAGMNVICSLVRLSDEKTTTTTLLFEVWVGSDVKLKASKNFADLVDRVLIRPLTQEGKDENSKPVRANKLLEEEKVFKNPPHPAADLRVPLRNPPLGNPYGSSDLDPFGFPSIGGGIAGPGFGGGGMLMDPSRGRGRLGPRYDPPGFRGPGAGQPNPFGFRRNYGDEMAPPDYDNMFG